MKLSISLPDPMAKEIKTLATQTERDISWWIKKAWEISRTQMMRRDLHERAEKKALKTLGSLRGALKSSYPDVNSVVLAHEAFRLGELMAGTRGA